MATDISTRVPSVRPPEAWEPLLRVMRRAGRPLERFLGIQAASGILLLVSASIALAWANSPWSASYSALLGTKLSVGVGSFTFERTLGWLIDDGLMTIFFFVVGLEIRREIHCGELSSRRAATLPIVAALAGMIVPAASYLSIATTASTRPGWGIPMATDIAFAVGVLTLLGARVPPALRVLLLALAVIDDLGAILVIAIFYSQGISFSGLAVASAGVAGVFAMQAFGIRSRVAYAIPAAIVWCGVYSAGIHPTIAGVVVGLATPVRAWLGPEGFRQDMEQNLYRLAELEQRSSAPHEVASVLSHVDATRREVLSPAENLIGALHPWVAFAIMPVFAFANAGVSFDGSSFSTASKTIGWAAFVGLVVGKPLGVFCAAFLGLRLRALSLPAGLGVRHLAVLALSAGIGFTMSLFIAQLAFADPGLLAGAKVGVLVASVVSGVLALLVGRALLRVPIEDDGRAKTADEAEQSADR